MIINNFCTFEIRFKEPVTEDNFRKLRIDVYENENYKGTFTQSYIGLDTAKLLTSDNIEEVREGFKLYKKSVTLWLDILEEAIF